MHQTLPGEGMRLEGEMIKGHKETLSVLSIFFLNRHNCFVGVSIIQKLSDYILYIRVVFSKSSQPKKFTENKQK